MVDASDPSLLKRYLYGGAGLSLLIALYLLPGLLGHDPWRGDDIEHFVITYDLMLGNWALMPTLAGVPSLDYGPLYYWVGALFGYAFGWMMPVHDAMRLATAFFAGMGIFWIARTSARLYGKHTRTPAALLTLGTLGLVVHAHVGQPTVALMAMLSMTLAGLALIPTQPLKGNLQAAIGIALAFLTTGLSGLMLTLPLFFTIVAACPECRTPRASGALILGLSIAVALCAAWIMALYGQSPELLSLWWSSHWENLGARALSFSDLPRLLELLGWFLWPLWPIACWAVWRARRYLAMLPWLLPLTSIALTLLVVFINGDLGPAHMVPLIPPLALLAAAGVPTLRRGAANAFDWFAVMTFSVFAMLVWMAWTAQVFAWPPGLARSIERMAPEFVTQNTAGQATLGIVICAIWIALVAFLPRTPNRGPANWAMGMTMLWCLTVTLLLPWFDYDRSYRPAVASLTAALTNQPPGCIAQIGLNSSHRASLYYFGGLVTEPAENNRTQCRYLLIHDNENPPAISPSRQWRPVWEYHQGGGRRLEIFQLYRHH